MRCPRPPDYVVRLAVLVATAWVLISVALRSRSLGPLSEGAPWSLSMSPDEDSATTGVTGKLFSGDVVRQLPTATKRQLHSALPMEPFEPRADAKHCSQWGVVTTIFDPSEAVKGVARMPDWCLVVATDMGARPFELAGDNVVVLDEAAQRSFGAAFSEFFDLLPWRHFARKNVGYLYAIAHGAEAIWDFDDDNQLREGADLELPTEMVQATFDPGCRFFNPYPLMGAADNAWPRGFPLNLIKRQCKQPELSSKPDEVERLPTDKVAIFQSLADNEPDVDGIFRLTQPIPFYFDPSQPKHFTTAIGVPAGLFAPFNAQATLFTQPAFWALLLPMSMHGRVSDIWRSFIAQRLLWDAGLTIAFMPPRVDQFRNPHNPLADMKAEEDLYYKTLPLLNFLSSWSGKGSGGSAAATLQGRMLELMVALYERDYIGLRDVLATAQWIRALAAVGYRFPPLRRGKAEWTLQTPAQATLPPIPSPTSRPTPRPPQPKKKAQVKAKPQSVKTEAKASPLPPEAETVVLPQPAKLASNAPPQPAKVETKVAPPSPKVENKQKAQSVKAENTQKAQPTEAGTKMQPQPAKAESTMTTQPAKAESKEKEKEKPQLRKAGSKVQPPKKQA